MSDADRQSVELEVGEAEVGQRLDRFLTLRMPSVSRNRIQRALAEGLVTVDARQRPKSYRLGAGQRICFTPLPVTEMQAVAQDIPLEIIFEDEHILVVNKPAGLVVHPAPGHPDGTLVNALLHHCRNLSSADDPLRPGIVHRLDQDTTGLLVVALSDAAHSSLAGQLKERTMKRRYQALTWGKWPDTEGTLEWNIGRNPGDRQKMAVLDRGGRTASTSFEVVEDFGFVQLCRVRLHTGRTHQIRVHFSHAGHPVVGDRIYGDDRRARNVRPVERALAGKMVRGTSRQLLHAAELTLTHPCSGHKRTFTCPLPDDFVEVVAQLRASNSG